MARFEARIFVIFTRKMKLSVIYRACEFKHDVHVCILNYNIDFSQRGTERFPLTCTMTRESISATR